MNTQNNPVFPKIHAIDKLKGSYLRWTKNQLYMLHEYLAMMERAAPDTSQDQLAKIRDLAHNIKGLGGSFGYYLMTDIASSLNEYILTVGKDSDILPTVIKAHITAMDMVINEDITGDGGKRGNKIITRLQKMTGGKTRY